MAMSHSRSSGIRVARAEELSWRGRQAASAPGVPCSPQTSLATAMARKNTRERRHDPHERRRVPQAGHDQHVGQHAEQRGHADRDEPGERRRPVPVAGGPVVEERADHRERALGEVDDARTAVDEDEALPGQRVDRADPQAEQDEAEELGQGAQPVTKSFTSRNSPSPDGTISPSLDLLRPGT